jgi:hypothetical protein
MLKYSLSNINIPVTALLKRLGYVKSTYLTSTILRLINDVCNLARKLINPKCSLAFAKLVINKDTRIILDNGYNINSHYVSSLLKDCFKIYGIAVTIGFNLENKVNDFLRKRELFNAVVLDAAGSVAVENLITSINLQIKQYEGNKHNIVTKRYSPGYGDWIINTNKALLDWLGASKIGININHAFQMSPTKSISAILGVMKRRNL